MVVTLLSSRAVHTHTDQLFPNCTLEAGVYGDVAYHPDPQLSYKDVKQDVSWERVSLHVR